MPKARWFYTGFVLAALAALAAVALAADFPSNAGGNAYFTLSKDIPRSFNLSGIPTFEATVTSVPDTFDVTGLQDLDFLAFGGSGATFKFVQTGYGWSRDLSLVVIGLGSADSVLVTGH